MLDGRILIEVRKVGFENKGAELMLYSVMEKLKLAYPDARFAMTANVRTAPYEKRAMFLFYQKVHLWKKLFQFGNLAILIPSKIRRAYGIVLDKEVDIVIDAAGFSYSDQWGKYSCLELADSCKRWKKNGTKIVLLPQAFGPFESSFNRRAMKSVLDSADLVVAREKVSYDYLVDIAGERKNLKQAPDFTNLIEGIVPDYFDTENNRFCIIPNYRMIDKTNSKDSDAYLPFMIEVTRYAYEKNQKPFILIHADEDDLTLAQAIRAAVSSDIKIIRESNPLKIKGIIGVSENTVGSRFHGLVSALSQGVPALATGWSHKYKMLFKDYDFEEGLLDVKMQRELLHLKLDLIINDTTKLALKRKLQSKSNELKSESREMWRQVLKAIK